MSDDAFAKFRAAQAAKAAAKTEPTPNPTPTPETDAESGQDGVAAPNPFARFAAQATPKPSPTAPSAPATDAQPSGTDTFAQFRAAKSSAASSPASAANSQAFEAFRAKKASTAPGTASAPTPAATPAASSVAATPPSLDLDLGLGLDLSAPAPSPAPLAPQSPAAPNAGPVGFDLDLDALISGPSTPQPEPASAPQTPAGNPGTSDPQPRHAPLSSALRAFPRLAKGAAPILGQGTPAVAALSRFQSGVGVLRLSLDTPSTGALTLGCVYETATGAQRAVTSTDTTGPITLTPAGHLLVNLRRADQIKRVLVSVRAKSPETIWDGIAYATLPDKTRMHFPLRNTTPHESMALATIHNVDGELVVRAEGDHRDVPARALCESYGYTQVAWRDDRTPLAV